MEKIKFDRLFAKKEIQAIIGSVAGLSADTICIRDRDGKVVFGTGREDTAARHEVKCEDCVLGWVSGGERAATAALVLNYIVAAELAKRELGRETLEKYKEIALFYSVTEKLAARLNPKEVADLILAELRLLIKTDYVAVTLFDEAQGVFVAIAEDGNAAGKGCLLLTEARIATEAALTGKAEIINEIGTDPRFARICGGVNAIMYAPLLAKGEVVGYIYASGNGGVFFSANDLKILSALAFLASSALENASLYASLREAFHTTVYTLAETIEKRDPYTGGHTKRVTNYSVAIGRELGLSAEEMERLELAAVLHDIGKIGIRDDILLAPRRLTDGEYKSMKMHTVYGEEILSHVKYLKDITLPVKHHHERVDGKGYPDGVAYDDINILARIIAVADAYDAMTSDRPYRRRMERAAAVAELERNAGIQFDAGVVEAFLRVFASEANE